MPLLRSILPTALALAAALPVAAQATLSLRNQSDRTWYVAADMPAQLAAVRLGQPGTPRPRILVVVRPNVTWPLAPGDSACSVPPRTEALFTPPLVDGAFRFDFTLSGRNTCRYRWECLEGARKAVIQAVPVGSALPSAPATPAP